MNNGGIVNFSGHTYMEKDSAGINNPDVTMVECYLTWDVVENEENNFDFSLIDRYINEWGEYGKKVNIRIATADNTPSNTPEWLYQKGVRRISYGFFTNEKYSSRKNNDEYRANINLNSYKVEKDEIYCLQFDFDVEDDCIDIGLIGDCSQISINEIYLSQKVATCYFNLNKDESIQELIIKSKYLFNIKKVHICKISNEYYKTIGFP